MAVLPILISGEHVLHCPADPVLDIDDDIRRLVEDLVETMEAAPGVGLAAPQVGRALRLFVYGWQDQAGADHRGVAINPELWLAPTSPGPPEDGPDSEGCLSFPGERFPLRRSPAVILRATDLDGSRYERRAEGWLARIFQHENDHLDGVLYVDRLGRTATKAVAKAARRNGWGVPGNSWLPGADDIDA